MKKAIIVGYTGQDGTYLNQLLEKKGYNILGISSDNLLINKKLDNNIIDIKNDVEVKKIIKDFQPNEIYYLAAVHQSSVDNIIEDGELFQRSIDINIKSLINFLESIRKYSNETKLFYAASSHIFGNPIDLQQNEFTPILPNCIYGITKSTGLHICHFYRNKYNTFISIGILYNHESPLRESKYVSKKIIETAVSIKLNNDIGELKLGDIESQVDWGYAPDYVDAIYRIMQQTKPDDFIISSGNTHSVKSFVNRVFQHLGLDWKKYVKIDSRLITKEQKRNLFGNNKKIRAITGWSPSLSFDEMIKTLVDEELKKHATK